MEHNVVSYPNDQIAIICERNDNKNNTFTLVPVEVSVGKLDDKEFFHSENGSYVIPAATDSNYIDNNEYKYVHAKCDYISEISKLYDNEKNVELLMVRYYLDFVRNMNIVIKDEGQTKMYSTSFSRVSSEIVGTVSKHIDSNVKESEVTALVPIKEIKKSEEVVSSLNEIDVLDLERHVKSRILKNDDLIEDLVTTIAMNYTAKSRYDVESMLSIGPTGSGKTETYRVIADYLGVPLTIYDTTLLTAAGYVGKDIDDVIRTVYANANHDLKLAEKSILVFDEIDKIAIRGNDVNDIAVQQDLLKVLDGYSYNVSADKGNKFSNSAKYVNLDTSFMTIAGLGAFPDVFESKEKKNTLGFINEESSLENDEITADDLIKFGLLAELIGRMSNLFVYKELSRDDLVDLLVDAYNSPLVRKLKRYEREFNAEVIYDKDFLYAVADEAILKKAGGRSLKKVIAYVFKKLDHELLVERQRTDSNKARKLVLTPDMVKNNRSFRM